MFFLTHSFSSFVPSGLKKHTPSIHLVSFPWPLLELIPLVQWKLEILPSNQWPPYPSRANENWKWFALQLILRWKFLGPMKHKKYSILQSNRTTILMINGIGGLILPLILDILMRFLSLILILFVRWPSHPTSSS
jgi:hypothetical protein